MWMIKDPNGVPRPFSFRSYAKFPVGKDETSLRHVWYSTKQARLTKYITSYRLADYEVVVDVTAASESPQHGCGWDDMQYLGVGWWVGSRDNDRHEDRGFDSNYNSIVKNHCREVYLPSINNHHNAYTAVRQTMGDSYSHSGVDAPEPLELISHPDNPVAINTPGEFLPIPATFRLTTTSLEGVPIGANRGGDGRGWARNPIDPFAQQ